MVAELVKHFTAVRRDAPLYHWRDATGHEIDVLIDAGDRLIPVKENTVSPNVIGKLISALSNPTRVEDRDLGYHP